MPSADPHNEPAKEVPVEVVSPGGQTIPTPSDAPKKTFFHPWSGLTILGADWLAFGTELPTGFLLVPVISVITYIVTYMVVYKIQIEQNGDTVSAARRKAIIGAVAAAVPFPITGTVFGFAILMLSGLPTSIRHAAWHLRDISKKP